MDIMEMTRELGKALQADDRYIAYNLAKQVNDNDAELQQQINDFDRMRNELNAELCKENKDTDKIKELDEGIKDNYKKIMSNKNRLAHKAGLFLTYKQDSSNKKWSIYSVKSRYSTKKSLEFIIYTFHCCFKT